MAPGGGPGDLISKRIGPLPLWGWTVIGAGAVGVLIILRKRAAGSSASQVPVDANGNPIGAGGGGGSSGSGGGVTVAPPASPTGGGPGASPPGTPGGPPAVPAPNAPTSKGGSSPVITAGVAPEGASSPYVRGITPSATAAALAGTIALAAQQVEKISPANPSYSRTISVTTGFNAANDQVAQALTAKGYTAGVWGGQVYAARNSADYFNGIPREAQTALAKLLVAQSKAAA